jgi:cysteinyl-tRNA synthetase
MAVSILGPSIDIHTGGEDNIFPHHECEIAQSEAATGKSFARFWMHARHLRVDGEKMSKSKGTMYTLHDLATRGYDPLAVRYALISCRYREAMNFTLGTLNSAAKNTATLREFAAQLSVISGRGSVDATTEVTSELDKRVLDRFGQMLDDDLNVSGGLGVIFDWISSIDLAGCGQSRAQSALAVLHRIDMVLGVVFPHRSFESEKIERVEGLMALRAAARRNRDWLRSDELRREIEALGVDVKDGPKGSTWEARLTPPT